MPSGLLPLGAYALRHPGRLLSGALRLLRYAPLCLLLMSLPAWAHPPIPQQLTEVNRALEAGADPALFLKRGELHRAHGQWNAALKDYDEALSRDPLLDVVHLLRGEALLALERWDEAQAAFDHHLQQRPDSVAALKGLGQVQGKQGHWEDAELAFALASVAAERTEQPSPDLQLLWTEAMASQGPEGMARAITTLDALQGEAVDLVLSQRALDLELALSRSADALSRLDGMAAASSHPARFWVQAGALLMSDGQQDIAKAYFVSAGCAILALPVGRRHIPANQVLVERIEVALGTTMDLLSSCDGMETGG